MIVHLVKAVIRMCYRWYIFFIVLVRLQSYSCVSFCARVGVINFCRFRMSLFIYSLINENNKYSTHKFYTYDLWVLPPCLCVCVFVYVFLCVFVCNRLCVSVCTLARVYEIVSVCHTDYCALFIVLCGNMASGGNMNSAWKMWNFDDEIWNFLANFIPAQMRLLLFPSE